MLDYQKRVAELRLKGMSCAQILMQVVGLEARGEVSPDLVDAMAGLTYGMYCQHTCGVLTGAACALAIYGVPRQVLAEWCGTLSDWFEDRYGAVTCGGLLGQGRPATPLCAAMMEETAGRCLELLCEAGLL